MVSYTSLPQSLSYMTPKVSVYVCCRSPLERLTSFEFLFSMKERPLILERYTGESLHLEKGQSENKKGENYQ